MNTYLQLYFPVSPNRTYDKQPVNFCFFAAGKLVTGLTVGDHVGILGVTTFVLRIKCANMFDLNRCTM